MDDVLSYSERHEYRCLQHAAKLFFSEPERADAILSDAFKWVNKQEREAYQLHTLADYYIAFRVRLIQYKRLEQKQRRESKQRQIHLALALTEKLTNAYILTERTAELLMEYNNSAIEEADSMVSLKRKERENELL